MSTAEHRDALTRRIEQLAAASADEQDSAAVTALVGAVLAELGAVRAELASVRSETRGVRSELDGLGGRLTGAVAAGRSETGALGHRVTEMAARLDGLQDRLGSRVDAVSGEVRRASAEHGAALDDARGALESRLAVLEDALGGLSERLEALARDGAGTTTGLLQSLGEQVRRLDRRLETQGAEAADVATQVGALASRLVSMAAELEQTVAGFRAEWPTRTYEVVEGAKAVAQAAVLDVRDEVAARLAEVRTVLAQAAGAVAQAPADPGADRGPDPAPRVARSGVRTRPAPGGTAVVPGPGKPGAASKGARRGRLDVMPEVPSVAVALHAAAPEGGAGADD